MRVKEIGHARTDLLPEKNRTMAKRQSSQPDSKIKTVTIYDIADEVGTSVATVNRALSNHGRISVETKRRILDTSERLGYRPSMVAQSLACGRSNTIGVIVPMVGDNVYSLVVRGLEQTARFHGYNIILCDTDSSVVGLTFKSKSSGR